MSNNLMIISVISILMILLLFISIKIRYILINKKYIKDYINIINNIDKFQRVVPVLEAYNNAITDSLNHTLRQFITGASIFIIIDLFSSIFIDIHIISFSIGFVLMSIPTIIYICRLADDINDMVNIIQCSINGEYDE